MTEPTSALIRSTGMLAIVQPTVYAPSAVRPRTRPTIAKSALLYRYQASRPRTRWRPKVVAVAILEAGHGRESRWGRHNASRDVLMRRPPRGPRTRAQYPAPASAN